jgi:hypothetical protein
MMRWLAAAMFLQAVAILAIVVVEWIRARR